MNDNVFPQDEGTSRTTSLGRKQFQTELAAYSVLFRFLQCAHRHVYEHLSEQNQHQHIKVAFLSPRPWGVHTVNAEGLGAAFWNIGTKKKILSGDLKEMEFAKKLSHFKSTFLCLGVAAEDKLFPTCTRLFSRNSRAVCRQCRYLVTLLDVEWRFKWKVLPLDPLLPGMIARPVDATKSSKCTSCTDLQGDKEVWFCFRTGCHLPVSQVGSKDGKQSCD